MSHKLFIFLIALVVILTGYILAVQRSIVQAPAMFVFKTTSPAIEDVYVQFEMEGYDIIQKQYWQKAPDEQLSQLFALGIQKFATSSLTLASSTRAGVADMLTKAIAGKSDAEKKTFVTNVLQAVLYSLAPTAHSQLLTSAAATELKNNVANVNPAEDPYATIGVQKGADVETIQSAYEEKRDALVATTSSDAKAQLAALSKAHTAIADPVNKVIYDQTGASPTLEHRVSGSTLYIGIHKMAPTTVYEVASLLQNASTTPGLNSLIIDLRGNLGGALDFTQNFFTVFFGGGSYVFDMFHQGELMPQRTPPIEKLDTMSRYREVAVLTDGQTQSTAELTASALRRARLARIVGTKTRGWGSVEGTYPISTVIDPKEQYAILLVAYLTVRDDGAPIEGNGVVPDVDITSPTWKSQLSKYFYSPDLIAAIKSEIARPPVK